MSNIKAKLANLIKKIGGVLYNKKLLIFIGKKSVIIASYNQNQIVNSIFSDYITSQDKAECYEFLKNYKKYEILILLDSAECQIKHEFMPMLHSIIKFNPVEKFIQENYLEEDIVAYNVYNIDDSSGEVWETLIASTSYTDKTSELIEFVIHNSFKFGGIYFLALEFEPIIDQILAKEEVNNYQNNLQIFSTITKSSGIRIAVKHKKNILSEMSIELPSDKSDLYISGMIRNTIEDKIIHYKSYIESLDLGVSLIFLCNSTLAKIFEQIPNFAKYQIITHLTDSSTDQNSIDDKKDNSNFINDKDNSEITQLEEPNQTNETNEANSFTLTDNRNNYSNFGDHKLLELFIKNRRYLAMNKLIKSITKLTVINAIIFKPLLIILISIITILGIFKYQEIKIQKETVGLNSKYYELSEKYRNIKKRHPEAENINNLTDFYNLQKILSYKSETPFEFLQKIFSVDTGNVTLSDVIWSSQDNDFLDKKISLIIYLNYTSEKKDLNLATKTLTNCLNQFKSLFEEYKVTYTINHDKIVELPKMITLPATVIIHTNTNIEGI